MRRGVPIPEDVEATIKAELAKIPHASRIARESRGAWSYATVWRVAARAGIELTAGRRTMGRPLPPETWAKVEQVVAAHPGATQLELARQCGVSRSTVGRVVRARRAAPPLAG
jgi:winged helix-turn-helix DNA-binding protein